MGNVTGTISHQPLAGINVALNSQTAATDANGYFQIECAGTGAVSLTLTGDTIYPRTAVIPVPHASAILQLDAIEQESSFDLAFYRELARGNHPTEGDLNPIHRWTYPAGPTIYIDTNPRATRAGYLSEETLELTRQVITQMVPVLSGGYYPSVAIQFQEFTTYDFDTLPPYSIIISYDDSLYARGGIGLTMLEPDTTSATGCALNKAWIFVIDSEPLYAATRFPRQALIAHELGHAFGYRHTSRHPSIMQKYEGYSNGLFSEHDRLHMAVLYARPAGNTDIDNDSLPTTQHAITLPRQHTFWEPALPFAEEKEGDNR